MAYDNYINTCKFKALYKIDGAHLQERQAFIVMNSAKF